MDQKRRRLRCPKCGSLNSEKWGVSFNNQRYRCKDCGYSFTPHREDVKSKNQFKWFRKWVLGKQTISDISIESGHSERQLRRWFEVQLLQVPEWTIRRGQGVHMLIDGTWLDSDHCLIVYRDFDNRSTVYYRFSSGEIEDEIIKDLQMFKDLKISISSFTTDGSDQITRAIKYVFPQVPRQRCIVHIQRECLLLLTQHPRTPAGIELRRLVCRITRIETNNDMLFWKKQLIGWYEEYDEFIMQQTVNKDTGEMSYTHDNIRKVYVHLSRALAWMFKYVDDPSIPNNTNAIESFFGHLKDNLRIHRGMTYEHKENFIKWYLYFANEKKSTR